MSSQYKFEYIDCLFDHNIKILKEVNSGFYNITHSRNIINKLRLNENKKTKKVNEWFRLKDCNKILESFKKIYIIDKISFILSNEAENQYRGTYVHKALFLYILQWLDPKYSLLITNTFNKLQNEQIIQLMQNLNLSNELLTTLTNKKDINNICGLYLCDLGSIKELRNKMNICKIKYPNDNHRVKKIGKSKDIINRFRQHKATYGKINHIRLDLFIDLPLCNITEAENTLKELCNKYLFDYNDGTKFHKELVIVSSTNLLEGYYKLIKKKYPNDLDTVITTYSNKEKDLKIENLELKNEVLELKMKILEMSK